MPPRRPQYYGHGLPEEKLSPHLRALTAGEGIDSKGIDIYTRPKCFLVNQGGSTWSALRLTSFYFGRKPGRACHGTRCERNIAKR